MTKQRTRTVYEPCPHNRIEAHLIEPTLRSRFGSDLLTEDEYDWDDPNHCAGAKQYVEYEQTIRHSPGSGTSWWTTEPSQWMSTMSYGGIET